MAGRSKKPGPGSDVPENGTGRAAPLRGKGSVHGTAGVASKPGAYPTPPGSLWANKAKRSKSSNRTD